MPAISNIDKTLHQALTEEEFERYHSKYQDYLFDTTDDLIKACNEFEGSELTADEINEVDRLMHEFSIDVIEGLNSAGVFTIEVGDTHSTHSRVNIVEGIVLSKACFKLLVGATQKTTYFSKKDMIVPNSRMHVIADIINKTKKYKQSDLKIILENRLSGIYKGKVRDNKNWNQGGFRTQEQVVTEFKNKMESQLSIKSEVAEKRVKI